jgi:NADPH-dependent curcumin reductase CurA
MADKAQYMPAVALGDVMRAISLAEVVESDDPNFPVGSKHVCMGGCCEYFIGSPGANILHPAGKSGLPLTADLSIMSIVIGLTAWHGVNKILCPTKDSIVVVSGAAGAVGSLVGQLAKQKGSKVIGICGGSAKCAWLKDELGFDLAIDYKTQDVEKVISEFAPEGVSHYFDNVGGQVSDAVLMNMSLYSRYALCGSISEYDDSWNGQKNFNMILMKRIYVQGFICVDHVADELALAQAEIEVLVQAGSIKYSEDIREGLATYPSTVRLLMTGQNTGKLILKL